MIGWGEERCRCGERMIGNEKCDLGTDGEERRERERRRKDKRKDRESMNV